jgi:hypothetical protein
MGGGQHVNEDNEHIIKDVNGNIWEEDSQGLWTCHMKGGQVGGPLTFSVLASRFSPLRIFREL